MRIGFVGLGRLGVPCALAMEKAGHDVVGHDPAWPISYGFITQALGVKISRGHFAYEAGVAELAKTTKIRMLMMHELIEHAELIFVAVQTPHDPAYDGATPIPETRRDFSYDHLRAAIRDIVKAKPEGKHVTVVVISTVLPGTMRRYINPLLPDDGTVELIYNPYFIAMGTVIRDFEHPEFALVGGDHKHKLDTFYRTIHNSPIFHTHIEEAELTKVLYNTFIGMKLAYANTVMEICHKTGCNSDKIIEALTLATDRIISPAYLRGGMGDGGGCHPRDNIALSWLARELKLSHDLFTDIMKCREDQTNWLADLIIEQHRGSGLPIYLLGVAFKPNTNLTDGSPALLLANMLIDRGYTVNIYDPHVFPYKTVELPETAALFFISTLHDEFKTMVFPTNSIVIDPWRTLPCAWDYDVISVGGDY